MASLLCCMLKCFICAVRNSSEFDDDDDHYEHSDGVDFRYEGETPERIEEPFCDDFCCHASFLFTALSEKIKRNKGSFYSLLVAFLSFLLLICIASVMLSTYYSRAQKNLDFVADSIYSWPEVPYTSWEPFYFDTSSDSDGYIDNNVVYVEEIVELETDHTYNFPYLEANIHIQSDAFKLNEGNFHAKLSLPSDGSFCVYNTKHVGSFPPTCTLEESLAWSNCSKDDCPFVPVENFILVNDYYDNFYPSEYITYFYIYPRVTTLPHEIDIKFQFYGTFTTFYSSFEVDIFLFISILLFALAVVVPLIFIIIAIVLKRLTVDPPPQENNCNEDNVCNVGDDVNLDSHNNVDKLSGTELTTVQYSAPPLNFHYSDDS